MLSSVFLRARLPQIGPTRAEELLRHFDTPYKVFEEIARVEISVSKSGRIKRLSGALDEVKGVGPVIVENVWRLLTSSFKDLGSLG